MRQSYSQIVGVLILVNMLIGCSVTKNLPSGEVLYTGQKTIITNKPKAKLNDVTIDELNAALDKTPSTKLFGILNIPFGMWVYNDFAKYKKGFGKWIFNKFAANPPVFISTVNPDVRVKVGTNILHDYGYFNGNVVYKTIVNKKDSLKASIVYNINMGSPYLIDTVYYDHFNPTSLEIMNRGRHSSLLKEGKQFNVSELDAERVRISGLLRNRGYFYFRPDYMTYQADTTLAPGNVSLKLRPIAGLPNEALRQYYVGKATVFLYGKKGEYPTDSMFYKTIKIHYYKKMPISPNRLYRWMHYQAYVRNANMRAANSTRLYNQHRQTQIQEKLSQLNIFNYLDLQYIPRDTTSTCDTLDVKLYATLSKPLDAELGFNFVTKSNGQTGPGATFGVTRNHVFGGGESWNVNLKGSYEWQTGSNKGSLMNSWELGLSTSLIFPRVVFPRFGNLEYDFPATTTFKLYVDQLNRAKYYKLLSFGGNATYDFQPTKRKKHSITPFKLVFNVLQNSTDEFKAVADSNPALYVSLRNQFIPEMEYTYTFDNTSSKRVKHPIWWQSTITSAGNLTSCIYRAFGRSFNEKDKGLLGAPFAQFVKLNTEFRFLRNIDRNNSLAGRATMGMLFTYGNSSIAPYSEQFYVGGANSIRGFTVRSIGPGGYHNTKKFAFLDQTGTFRFETNIEYRFRMFKSLWGATFIDAGNVWLLRKDPERTESQLTLKNIGKQIALGTGFGFRYDLDFLIVRLDFGVPLHYPYTTANKGYFNAEGSFLKNLGIHFAIGYPF